ncbi:retrovirus-related pol polyprotein from transposon TNT 1-94 [Tanacetum coccineum]
MLLLYRTITRPFFTPTNDRLCTSSNTRNQAITQDGRVDIQSKNVGNSGRILRTTSNSGNGPNIQCYNYNEKGHYARDCPNPRVCDSKYFQEQMLLAKKDNTGILLSLEFVIIMSNSLQAIHMLGPKPNSLYDPILKTGLGYKNPYTLKRDAEKNHKLYDDKSRRDSKVHVIAHDTEKVLENAKDSRLKMNEKLKDPKAIEKKVNFFPIDYKKLNKLSKTFVPQANVIKSSSPPLKMPKQNVFDKFLSRIDATIECLEKLVVVNTSNVGVPLFYPEVKALRNIYAKSKLEETLKQNETLKESSDRILKATLANDIVGFVLLHCGENKCDLLDDKIEKIQNESKDVQDNLNARVKRALFTSPVAAKSKFLDATPTTAKTRFDVVTPHAFLL